MVPNARCLPYTPAPSTCCQDERPLRDQTTLRRPRVGFSTHGGAVGKWNQSSWFNYGQLSSNKGALACQWECQLTYKNKISMKMVQAMHCADMSTDKESIILRTQITDADWRQTARCARRKKTFSR